MLFFQNFFQFLHDLTQLLQRIENIFFIDGIYCCFFVFLSNQENLYMIHHDFLDALHALHYVWKK